MAETITIPSPSVFLDPRPSPLEQAAAKSGAATANGGPKTNNAKSDGAAKKRNAVAKPSQSAKDETTKVNADGVTKRKQSKSRNGCVTCKAKRLKCDESKPTCQQCTRRSVTCGGYKKDFKWRPFEETAYTSKAPPGKVKKHMPMDTLSSTPTAFAHPNFPSPSQLLDLDPPYDDAPTSADVQEPFDPGPVDPGPMRNIDPMLEDSIPIVPENTASSSLSSGQSPRLIDLLLPGTDLNLPNPEYVDYRARFPDAMYQPVMHEITEAMVEEEGDIEEVIRHHPSFSDGLNPEHEAWVMRLPTPPISSSSSSSSEGTMINPSTNPWTYMVREPLFSPSSPEMLTLRFDRQTCGVLSVKDGPTENPWRTLIWPLARDNSALYHAIASMTSFHYAREEPGLRVQGIEHMRTSIKALAQGIGNMRLDTAIATTLALAFSESWDQHISTGINHIKGAKILVNQALTKHRRSPYGGEELSRFKFLANTWIYMDVIARLTSVDEDESNDFEFVFSELSDPFGAETQLDPLMGCAGSLFPIIGRVTNLVRKVRRTLSNSPAIISQALDLKTQLESWIPPSFFDPPEDPCSAVEHSLQTAEAYRWATLLYLHQAVPEIPSASSAELAKKVMIYLATVPLGSRAIIVQIYPLIAAGCEAFDEEDRQWVRDRWMWMARTMKLGIIDRCAEVVKEVWDRRDSYEPRSPKRRNASTVPPGSLKRGFSLDEDDVGDPFQWDVDDIFGGGNSRNGGGKRRATTGVYDVPHALRLSASGPRIRKSSTDADSPGGIDPEFTVKGSLHWIGVMKDWKWEVLLG
ncbi:hypothetical protein NA57DRAFT_66475 [Rhizodiscina lignyota]|uniref:Zn(2)-C6 fungal-type domain-containing protein n=1 Tax=Rhizodiscina lignyota TaxID=1504668 RepID=A0A9P4M847_9PEZI|nr:hypothetical protein NA57DRAFT_66475 [Rhizodiscina lignyota]